MSSEPGQSAVVGGGIGKSAVVLQWAIAVGSRVEWAEPSGVMKRDQQSKRRELIASGVKGGVQAFVSRIPVLKELLAGWSAYKRRQFELYVKKFLGELQEQVDDLQMLFSDEWVKSDEGKQFVRKVFACAVNGELEDKHQLFANVLVNGIKDKGLLYWQKLKFVDMLRQLSLVSLRVLAEMDRECEPRIRRPGRVCTTEAAPQVSRQLVRRLSKQCNLHPYLVESSINEMKSAGLFSQVSAWRQDSQGQFMEESFLSEDSGVELYSDFSAQFAEFIEERLEDKFGKLTFFLLQLLVACSW